MTSQTDARDRLATVELIQDVTVRWLTSAATFRPLTDNGDQLTIKQLRRSLLITF